MVRKSWLRSKVEIQTVRNVVTPHVILIVTVCQTMPNTLLNSPRSDEINNLRAMELIFGRVQSSVDFLRY